MSQPASGVRVRAGMMVLHVTGAGFKGRPAAQADPHWNPVVVTTKGSDAPGCDNHGVGSGAWAAAETAIGSVYLSQAGSYRHKPGRGNACKTTQSLRSPVSTLSSSLTFGRP
jgi:hypothetical protein